MSDWPIASLDEAARLRALAAALPHAAYGEAVIDARFDAVWAVVGDLEHGVPRFEGNVSRIEIIEREGDRLRLQAWGVLGLRFDLEAILRPGWCVMRSRSTDIGMAAAPFGDGSRTRFAHFEASRVAGRLLAPFLRRNVAGDLRRLAALFAGLGAARPESR